MVSSVLEPVLRSSENRDAGIEEHPMDLDVDVDTGASKQSTEPIPGTSVEFTPPVAPADKTPPGPALPVFDSPSPPSTVDSSSTFQPNRRDIQMLKDPVLFTQDDVDNLAKDLRLSDKLSELLGS